MMEGSGTGISRLDCYEDMFKEITRKLYGEDPDHRTSSVQNEFETSVSYKNDEDTGNGTDSSDDGNWTCEDEPLKGTEGSRIAAYHAGKATWRCYECGDVMTGGPREAAEHFMELHSSRILADDIRGRHHSQRKDYLQADLKIEEIVSYLERLRERAERAAPPTRRTQETQTIPAALLPMTSTFLLQELPTTPTTQHLHQNSPTMQTSATTVSASGKRYTCPYCPYGTDRRDLYTRHENIHREEKPFHCYVCYKPFNRADHVKKHFLRMHREHPYELSRIRRPAGTNPPKPLQPDATANTTTNNGTANGQQPQHQQQQQQPQQQQPQQQPPQQQQQQQQQQQPTYPSNYTNNKSYQLQPNPTGSNNAGSTGTLYQTTTMPTTTIMQQETPTNCNAGGRRIQNGGCNSKSHLKAGSKSSQERRYTCCYCSWSGVDNWCLKRHLNTHLKPFACTLCEYKAARAERLATHVLKVHNRRQCSRCSFLGEDATQLQLHQLHVHRVSSTGNSSSASSTTTNSPAPTTNRTTQPIHPVGGGRPPPGPPVFPAPAPAITPTSTVIPPTTILGYRQPVANHSDESYGPRQANVESKETSIRRSRKQSQPRKVTLTDEDLDTDECPAVIDTLNLLVKCEVNGDVCDQGYTSFKLDENLKLDDKTLRLIKRKRGGLLLRCHKCPNDALANGSIRKPYHTKASLTLHNIWRHGHSEIDKQDKGLINDKNLPMKHRQQQSMPVSAITLKATVFTSPDYGYHR